MTKTKEKDFVEIEYTGRIKETNQIFDLTSEELAKKENIYNPKANYGPKVICLGEGNILKSLDGFLMEKETGVILKIELKPNEAFGNKNPDLIKIFSVNDFKDQKINPFPGLQINASGMFGTVRSVSGGRVTIDFNHPLAGKNLVYEIKINRIVSNNIEKADSLTKNLFELSKKDYALEIKENKAFIKFKVNIPEEAKKLFLKKANELIPSLEFILS